MDKDSIFDRDFWQGMFPGFSRDTKDSNKMTNTQFARGARPTPRHRLAAATPHQPLGAAPSAYLVIPKQLSYWLNQVDGCCVTSEEAFNKACSGILIQDQVMGAWASRHGVLNGASLDEVLNWMTTGGFSQDGNLYNNGRPLSVDWTNQTALQGAIASGHLMGSKPTPVKIGVAADQLQNVPGIGGRNGSLATGFRHDPHLDHCVSLCGYGSCAWLLQQLGGSTPPGFNASQPGYALFTWDGISVIDQQSMLAITGEAWVRSPSSVIVGSGVPSPDVVTVVGPVQPDPTPTPIPTPVPEPVVPPQWVNFLNWLVAFVRKNGKSVLPWVESVIAKLPLPPVVILAIDAMLENLLNVKRFAGRMGFFPINWDAFLAWVKEILSTYGKLAIPLIEGWVSTLPLPPLVAQAIDSLIEQILGGGVKFSYNLAA